MTNTVKILLVNMNNFGETIRQLRVEKELPLRTVAAYLNIDQAILSKIERGQRNANRKQVVKLAKYFKIKESDLLVSWLSDKLVHELADEKLALDALKIAEEKIGYRSYKKINRKSLINNIRNYLSKDKRVEKAWILGSFAREEEDYKSDIDMLIDVSKDAHFSYFDLADVQHHLEKLTTKKIDIGFYGSMRPGIWEQVKNELKLIYEK